MLHLDVYIDLIYIMRVGREFIDSIKHLLFVYKNSIKNNFTFLINFFEILIYTAKRIDWSTKSDGTPCRNDHKSKTRNVTK